MADVVDVAKYMLERQGPITPLMLQKLVYYAQVWSIAEGDSPLFADVIKAWAQGPVVPALFHQHKGLAHVEASDLSGNAEALTEKERSRVDWTLSYYGSKPAVYLSDLTHHEQPWKEARAHGHREGFQSPSISIESIRSFYAEKSPEELEVDYQLFVACQIMDEHAESLARLAQ